ncbi:Phosphatidylinositol-binding clathrin assembly protein LAP-like protein [Leptotrombidium deliense]|uniref:Phosphatidylinositol-binding clathrin assembly protein LAP-like protein n=1 Tax=Leptotrombidium deliense TaxID=299467 RepID=A0A443SPZ2_9ACAR|nr:Phosphatidylinositol-binding clathrin assembly protein LAP-like protein [Leptotrombidium deliense]
MHFVYVAGFDAFGDILQPQKPGSFNTPNSMSATVTTTSSGGGLIKGDLDSSLASLAQNLDINGPKGGGFKKPGQQQFNSPKNVVKTGGSTWAGTQMTATQPMMSWPAGAPVAGVPMNQGMNQWGANTTGMQAIPGVVPQYGVQMRPIGMMPAMVAMPQSTGVMPMVAPIMSTGGMVGPRAPVSNAFSSGIPSMSSNYSSTTGSSSDPFGAL